MPVIPHSTYDERPYYFKNGHLETIVPSFFRSIKGLNYVRERINTPDDDFLDIDWAKTGSNRLLVVSHGLEGSSERHYVMSCAKYFHERGWDVIAWNYRSCSGEMNKQLRLYHHGVTDDLATVIEHGLKSGSYEDVALVGFSMGGSTTLKFLGEQGTNLDPRIKTASVFSVPCNLWNSAEMLTLKENRFYRKRFLNKLKAKVKGKAKIWPDKIDLKGIEGIKTFDIFDERYTAPLHGFKDAMDFYLTSTSDKVYNTIAVPALIVNAKNDPLLGEKCYPYNLVKDHKNLFLETPELGGHVGFSLKGKDHSYMDERAFDFISQHVSDN